MRMNRTLQGMMACENKASAVAAHFRVRDALAAGIKALGWPFRPRPRPQSHFTKPKTGIETDMNTTSLDDRGRRQRPIQFAFPAPEARQVSLAGDFNNWDSKATPMHKGPDGVWHLGVALKPGRHEYRFVADGVWQDDPAAQERTANALGSHNCVRNVAA